jgi:hypothetical protein
LSEVFVITRFFDRQNTANPLNGTTICDSTELRRLLDSVSDRPPFFAELIGENGFKLLLGIGSAGGCAQFSAADGSAPYLMAVAEDGPKMEGEIKFLIGDTASPVPKRYLLPYLALVDVAAGFVSSGERCPHVAWEEV